VRGSKVLLAASALALVAGAAFAADAPAAPAAASSPAGGELKAYVTAFCGPVAASDAGMGDLMQHLSKWEARGASETRAETARPQDSDAPGQLFLFKDADAPTAFIDRRRGVCSLVYAGPRTPDVVLLEMASESLPTGEKGGPSRWRHVTRTRFGPPGPLRYFLKIGENEGFGLCSTIFEDLRLRDGSPVTMVRVSTCRLGPDEKLDNG